MTRSDERLSIASALQGLTEDLLVLFREHLRLFGTEIRRDTAIAGRYVGAVVFFGVIALGAYGLLNLSVVLFAGWALGLPGMAWTSLALASVNGGIAVYSLKSVMGRLQEDQLGPRIATSELERSRTWAKQN